MNKSPSLSFKKQDSRFSNMSPDVKLRQSNLETVPKSLSKPQLNSI
jgi:hypothetical protein